MDHRHNVLHGAISRIYTFRGPVESGTHLLPSALVTAERAPMITTSSARDHRALKGSGRPSTRSFSARWHVVTNSAHSASMCVRMPRGRLSGNAHLRLHQARRRIFELASQARRRRSSRPAPIDVRARRAWSSPSRSPSDRTRNRCRDQPKRCNLTTSGGDEAMFEPLAGRHRSRTCPCPRTAYGGYGERRGSSRAPGRGRW